MEDDGTVGEIGDIGRDADRHPVENRIDGIIETDMVLAKGVQADENEVHGSAPLSLQDLLDLPPHNGLRLQESGSNLLNTVCELACFLQVFSRRCQPLF